MLKPLVIVAAAVALLSGSVLAQSPAPAPAAPPAAAAPEPATPAPDAVARGKGKGDRGLLRSACRTDIATHCQGAEAGRGRRIACLEQNQSKLTPECASAVQARLASRGDRQGRKGDRADGAKPGDAASAPAAGERVRGRFAACRTDMATFCQNVAKGGGQRIKCLRDNADKVTPQCQAALAEAKAARRAAR